MAACDAPPRRWLQRFTPLAVLALVIAAGARAASPPADSAPAGGAHQLTERQYRNAIADIFGEDIQVPGRTDLGQRPQASLPADAGNATAPPQKFEQYNDAFFRVSSASSVAAREVVR